MTNARKGIKKYLKESGIKKTRVAYMGDNHYKVFINSNKDYPTLKQVVKALTEYLKLPIESLHIYFRKED